MSDIKPLTKQDCFDIIWNEYVLGDARPGFSIDGTRCLLRTEDGAKCFRRPPDPRPRLPPLDAIQDGDDGHGESPGPADTPR